MSYIRLRARCCAVLLGLVIIAGVTRPAQATVIDTQVFAGNGHTYKLLASSSWQAAQDEAQSLGGNLVTVNDAAENAFVYNTFKQKAIDAAPATGKVNLWLGTNDTATEGTWLWASGLSSTFSDWFADQPQDTFGDEDFGGIRVRGRNASVPVGKWIDIVSDNRLGDVSFGVVEIVSGSVENPPAPEPASFVLAALGATALIAHRRAKRERTNSAPRVF